MVSLADRLAVLLGSWTVCTIAPPLSYGAGGPFDGSVAAVDGGIVVALAVAGVVGARVAIERGPDPAERFREGLALGGPMALAAIVMFVSLPVGLVEGLVAAAPFGVGGVLGFFLAFLVGFLADRTVVARSRAATDHRLVWTAKKRPDAVWLRGLRVVGAVVALVVAWLVGTAGGQLLAAFWALVGLLQLGLLVVSRRRRQYELVDAGLITAFGYLPWAEFDGYETTDEALLLYGNVWPFGTIAYDRASVDDLDAVVEALDRYLPREEEAHQDPSVVDAFRELLSS